MAIIPSGRPQEFVVQNGDFPQLPCLPEHDTTEGTLLLLGRRVVGMATGPDYALRFRPNLLMYLTKPVDPANARLAENARWATFPDDERLAAFANRFKVLERRLLAR
ncbi:MAG TPA: hypothetical protein VLG37_02230 [Candidatus Saccharimonadales bacterium]|nr:hypothetical protein [Candidatus Saccharimonadales bacterium]